MNKTITIYELLRLVKDGKAPKKIKYNGDEYTYNDCKGYEIDSSNYNLFETTITTFILNDTVEIIEDNDKLEKIPYQFNLGYININDKDLVIKEINKTINGIYADINKIIDHINKIEERLDER